MNLKWNRRKGGAALVEKESNQHGKPIHALINTLIQLQELLLVRAEQKVSESDKHLSQLDASIEALYAQIPAPTRTLFQKMQKKDIMAIVPIYNNVCTGCGLTLPISLVYAVRAGEKLFQCTHCARIIYHPEVRPRGVSKTKFGHSEPIKTGIVRFSSQSLMLPNIHAATKDDAMKALAMKIEEEGFVDDGQKLLNEALKREAIINTAVDHGIAFPHVRGVEGGGLTLALATSQKGVSFDAAARALTHIIFFIVIPTAASVFYLRLMSGLAQTFSAKEARQKLLSANTPEELWAALIKTTRFTIK
jgi:mannitol/fructose-specific phosphotransferase system IIA component (Ntr-type)